MPDPTATEAVRRLSAVVKAMPTSVLHFTLRSVYGKAVPNRRFHADLEALLSSHAALVEAVRPFAKIKPSNLYEDAGSEREGYVVLLKGDFGNPIDFTGRDLRTARDAYLKATGESDAG